MFTLNNMRTPNMTWITETLWISNGYSLGLGDHWNGVSVITEMMQYLLCCIFFSYQQWWTKGTLGTQKTIARWFLTAKLEWRARDARRKKTEMDWISSGSLSGWKCNLLQATQGRPNILPLYFSHRLVSVEMRDGDVLVQVALWVFLKDCKVLPCKSSTNLYWGHMGQNSF